MKGLILGCGALARELKALLRTPGLAHYELRCLPAELHNRPASIAARVREELAARAADYDQVFVAYADCGTAGELDAVLAEFGAQRLRGAHCYAAYAGEAVFARLMEEEPGSFFLTDFLVRHFQRLVISGLGLDRNPQWLAVYFGNYRRLVYLAQAPTDALQAAARAAARRLGLAYEYRYTGYQGLLEHLAAPARAHA